MYYRYKSSFLDNTLSQLIDDDGFELPLDSDQSLTLDSTFSLSFVDTPDDSSSFLSNFSNLDEVESSSLVNIRNVDENHVIKNFQAEEVNAINENSWGTNLNKKPQATKVNQLRSSNSQSIRQSMTEKLFPMSNFTKRNPRKSLSRNNLQSSSSLSSSLSTSLDTTRETLPDLETILAQKALQEKAKEVKKIPKPSTLNIDKGWLSRCDDSGDTKIDVSSKSLSPAEPKQYGLSNINPQIYAKCTYDRNDQSDDDEVIENSEDETDVKPRNVRHVLKKRKVFDVLRIDKNQPTNHVNETTVESVRNDNQTVPKEVQETKTKPVEMKTEPVETKTEPVKSSKAKKSVKGKKANRKPTPATAAPLRRSSRVVSTGNHKVVDDEPESEPDPFADDSHSDPEFQPNDPYELPEEPVTTTSPIVKKGSTKKIVKAKTTTGQRRGKKKNKNDDEEQPVVDNAIEDMPEDYVSQIEIKNLRNIPRINIDQLKEDTVLFQEYVNSKGTGKPSSQPMSVPMSPSKRELEREKLEKKIAAGKLNENFVRIDVRKKVFVRGKKTINFSKYKKAKWKKQKAANALAGPEMDMRGCDGGFLVCFNCGQQGHFAQDCKIQCKSPDESICSINSWSKSQNFS